mmetsp:Transcript_48504/g.150068  ORF Transcript_48504/g.150068 Transcript_48504/m.150068 type:complete len:251 (+) Transcript_48504:547-1299(+)
MLANSTRLERRTGNIVEMAEASTSPPRPLTVKWTSSAQRAATNKALVTRMKASAVRAVRLRTPCPGRMASRTAARRCRCSTKCPESMFGINPSEALTMPLMGFATTLTCSPGMEICVCRVWTTRVMKTWFVRLNLPTRSNHSRARPRHFTLTGTAQRRSVPKPLAWGTTRPPRRRLMEMSVAPLSQKSETISKNEYTRRESFATGLSGSRIPPTTLTRASQIGAKTPQKQIATLSKSRAGTAICSHMLPL